MKNIAILYMILGGWVYLLRKDIVFGNVNKIKFMLCSLVVMYGKYKWFFVLGFFFLGKKKFVDMFINVESFYVSYLLNKR